MAARYSRRTFMGKTAAIAAATTGVRVFHVPGVLADPSPNSKLNIAGIGVGGRGGSHVQASLAENLVAVCDTSQGSLDGSLRVTANKNKPKPKTFFDYREMFDKIDKEIDAVFVATPDHHHAPASMRAIKLGKHVYCEKPLTHNINEARQLTLAAREHKVATQMGNQGRASESWRLLAEMIWSGIIGDVQEAHVWTDRPGIPSRFWWPQGGTRPSGSESVPSGLHWDEWLGAAPERPYVGAYADGKFKGRRVYTPFVWRGWWDFGTGALGDIGCHALSGTFTALKIERPAAVELVKDSGDNTSEMFPCASIIRWDIPARADMAPCQIYWYDGGLYPPRDVGELAAGKSYPGNGTVLVGSQGKITLYGGPRLLPESRMKDFQKPDQIIPRCESDHFTEWVTACKGGRSAFSNFDHAGPLTELVLLGNLAIRAGVGKKLPWDGVNNECTNYPDLNQYVGREYRRGWEL